MLVLEFHTSGQASHNPSNRLYLDLVNVFWISKKISKYSNLHFFQAIENKCRLDDMNRMGDNRSVERRPQQFEVARSMNANVRSFPVCRTGIKVKK